MSMLKISIAGLFMFVLADVIHSGTVTADKIETGELMVGEIGLYNPDNNGSLYFSFSQNEGAFVIDESGNGYDATMSGCVWVNSGLYPGCVYFDGYNDYIYVGSAPNVPAWSRYSVSVWFLHNGGGDFSTGYGHKIIDKTSMMHDWYIRVYPPNGALYWIMYEGGGLSLNDASHNYMDSTWHNVIITRDGNIGGMWVDGVLKASTTAMKTVNSSSDLCVGNSFSSDSYQRKAWSGLLDEVRIFNYPLSSNEVVRVYHENSLSVSNAPVGISVTTNLTVSGSLTSSGSVSFVEGITYTKPLGGLSSGIYTNTP